ncbi:MAG: hypothetical protein AABZ44_05370, partial [Elusimicrobiota bacterium]
AKVLLTGDVPNPIDPPLGCRFHPRCRWVKESCRMGTMSWVWSQRKAEHGALCPVAPFAAKASEAAIHFKEN